MFQTTKKLDIIQQELRIIQKTVSQLQKQYLNTPSNIKKPTDGRHTAKNDENIRVHWICQQINSNLEIGQIMKQDYFNLFNKHISKVQQKGTNSDHYDILIHHTDHTTQQCEEKGSKHFRQIHHNNEKKPWENAVQRYNGTCKEFSSALCFAVFESVFLFLSQILQSQL